MGKNRRKNNKAKRKANNRRKAREAELEEMVEDVEEFEGRARKGMAKKKNAAKKPVYEYRCNKCGLSWSPAGGKHAAKKARAIETVMDLIEEEESPITEEELDELIEEEDMEDEE